MITIKRTNSTDKNFQELVKALDLELKIRDGADHSFYHQFNSIDTLKYVMVAYQEHKPVGCGAIKEYSGNIMEIKRMFVPETERGKGIATALLKEVETWAKELAVKKCILETGKNQPEAIALYKKCGYAIIPNYGQYENVSNSVCFEKVLV